MKALWIILGSYTMMWGLWLLSPWWEVFSPRAGLYSKMHEFMPEWAWGLHAFLIGIAILYGIIAHWPRGLWWGHIAGTYHWALIGGLYLFGDWHNTGALTSFSIVVAIHFMWKATPQTPAVHPLDSSA